MTEFRKMLIPPDIDSIIDSIAERAIEKMHDENVLPVVSTHQLMGMKYKEEYDRAFCQCMEQAYIGNYMQRILFRDEGSRKDILMHIDLPCAAKDLGNVLYLSETGKFKEAYNLVKTQKEAFPKNRRINKSVAVSYYIYSEMGFSYSILAYLTDDIHAGEESKALHEFRGRAAMKLIGKRYRGT
jgi:hypothetical protein